MLKSFLENMFLLDLGPLLIIWISFNPSMDNWWNAQQRVGWITCLFPNGLPNNGLLSTINKDLINDTMVHGNFGWDYSTNLVVLHYSDVIMNTMASQITGVSIVCPTVCTGADQRNHQSSASLAFVREIHRWPVVPFTQRASNAENASIW